MRDTMTAGGKSDAAAIGSVFGVIAAFSFCHLLNDMMQSLLPAIYPGLKTDLGLSFGQIGLAHSA